MHLNLEYSSCTFYLLLQQIFFLLRTVKHEIATTENEIIQKILIKRAYI